MKTIKAKFNSKCCSCGHSIRKGETITYDAANRRAHHEKCLPWQCSTHDKSASHEDWACSDTAYEDRCADMCGYGL